MAESQRTPKIPSNHRQAERFLIQFVHWGVWEIDARGQIWRRLRRTVAHGATAFTPVARQRVERRTVNGYLSVRAMVDGRRVTGFAHRLVWQYFNGDIEDGAVINHINGIKDCNVPTNLEPVSYSRNTEHAYEVGLRDEHGEGNPAHKLTNNEVAQIRNAYASKLFTQKHLADRFGVKHQQISRIVRGQRRPKQGGPILKADLRHSVCANDPITGRFLPRIA